MSEPSPIVVRTETEADHPAVRRLHDAAFGQPAEGTLVEALRRDGDAAVSLVAAVGGEVVGHILFSPLWIEDGATAHPGVALAPMAVLPAHQRRGIGGRLVRAGLEACRAAGHRRVVVLGHPAYYPRFGFTPARAAGIRCPYDAPDEVWMALALAPGGLDDCAGLVRYAPAFAEL